MSGRDPGGPLDFGEEDRRPEPTTRAEQGRPQPARGGPTPPGTARYGWFVAIAAIVLLVVVAVWGFTNEGVETGGPRAGEELAPFAVPLADSSLDGDANVATEAGQDELGPRPACEVRGPEILNICEEAELGPVVLAIFPTDAERCRAVLEQMRRVGPQFPGVRFVAVGSRGDRDVLRGDWGFPVGWDRDGAVAARYGLVGCPQVTFARKGGEVVDTIRREIGDGAFAGKVREVR